MLHQPSPQSFVFHEKQQYSGELLGGGVGELVGAFVGDAVAGRLVGDFVGFEVGVCLMGVGDGAGALHHVTPSSTLQLSQLQVVVGG